MTGKCYDNDRACTLTFVETASHTLMSPASAAWLEGLRVFRLSSTHEIANGKAYHEKAGSAVCGGAGRSVCSKITMK